MSSGLVLFILLAYFGILILISYFTSRKSDNETFFTANRTSPWYLVAFGMIGTSLSGVTFISIPGEVGNSNWTYLPVVMGNCIGYVVIALVLLPLFYKLNLVSIYSWLGIRFGEKARLTGSFFFILSQLVGASFRLFLVVGVLQLALFDSLGIPFALTVFITLGLVWIYTFRGGIKTIVWTDTLQTVFMLISVVLTIAVICQELDLNFSTMAGSIRESSYARIFDWDWRSSHNSLKQFLAGIAITVAINAKELDLSFTERLPDQYVFFFFSVFTYECFISRVGSFIIYICGDENRRTSRKIGRCFCFFIDELFRSNHRFIFLAGHNGSCLLFCRFFPDLFNHFLQYRFFEDRSKGSFAKTPENRSTSDFFAIDVYRSNSFSGIE